MKHVGKAALLGSAAVMERKGDDEGPEALVQKAVEDLTKTVDQRLNEIEKKADTTKLNARLDKIEAKQNRPAGGDDDKAEPTVERKAFAAYLRLGQNAPADELKALTVAVDTQGGYLAPAEMSQEFVRDLVLVSPVRAVASVRSTGSPSVIYPKRTGITNAKWKGEGQTQEASQPGFGQVEVVVDELTTYVDISNRLLADSAGQAEAEVRLALVEDFAQKEGLAFVSGSGAGQPEGILTNGEIAFTPSGNASAIVADSLITLLYAMPATYRNVGAFGMNGTTLGLLRKLKDGDGRFLWQPSYAAGQPETILGRPVVEIPDMPDVAAGTFPIIFGDWQGYRIVDRLDMSLLVNPYIRATDGITRIHATRRVGGRVIQAARFRKLKIGTS